MDNKENIPRRRAKVVSGKAKKKSGGGKLVRNLIITIVLALLYFYFSLPAINLHNPDFYFFCFLISGVFTVLTILSNSLDFNQESWKGIFKEIRRVCRFPLYFCITLIVIYLVGSLLSSPFFRSRTYHQLMTVTEEDFASNVDEAQFDNIPMLDKNSAERLGDRKLGELSDMVSQFEVNSDYTQINYQGRPVRVATLRYGDVFKWLNNSKEGLPAYVIIDMVTQEVDVVRLEDKMKYSPSDYFGRYLQRHLRFNFPTYMFATPHLEIDDDGYPYWICPRIVKTIGLFGGTDIRGAVIVDAITGDSQYIEDVPVWVDQLYTAELVIQQYDYYGQYGSGFLNSIFGQKGVTITTDDYNFLAMHDDVYVYTGITSVGSDESNIGFILCNQRTKETTYYPCAGAEEYSAKNSAEGMVQDLKYTATFPLLLNVSSQPTYFMSLKDSAGLVKMYSMVNVQRYNIAATGNTVEECYNNYLGLLAQNGIEVGNALTAHDITGTVTSVHSSVIEGTTYYYFKVVGEESYYRISAAVCEAAAMVEVNDIVEISGVSAEEGEIISAGSIKVTSK